MMSIVVSLAKNLLVSEFGLSQLHLDLLGVQLPFLNSLATLLKDLKQRSEGILVENEVNYEK